MKYLKILLTMFGVLAILLSGCRKLDQNGDIAIALTDAKGDFVTYEVNVVKLNLRKASGAVVDTIPESTSVDFAQYTDLTEFFTAATIPSGVYTHATVTLDYANANIQVEAEDGSALPVTQIVDANGNALTTVELSVKLDGRNKLTIAPGIPAMLALDFDLSASNKVEFVDATTPKVTVEPYLLASIEPDADKQLRARGLLKSVDTANNSFNLIMRPFRQLMSGADSRFGARTVSVNDTTQYEINGTSYVGASGLTALSSVAELSSVVVRGTFNLTEKAFLAQQVYAGSSVPGNNSDVITGNVVKRVGNTLTVRGATLERAQGAASFHDTVTVELTDATKVKRQLDQSSTLTIADISIGQRLVAFGDFNTTTKTVSTQAVRLLPTVVEGTITQVSNGSLVLNVQDFDRRNINNFDFTGSGASATQYEVQTTNLTTNLTAGDVVRVLGNPASFTSATPDFVAKTVVNLNDVRAQMAIGWPLGTSTPFSSTSSDSIQMKLPSAGLIHHVVRGGITTDLFTVGSDPIVKIASTGARMVIKQAGVITLHTTFADFLTDVNARIDQGGKLRGTRAVGSYDNAANTITTKRLEMLIQ